MYKQCVYSMGTCCTPDLREQRNAGGIILAVACAVVDPGGGVDNGTMLPMSLLKLVIKG